MRRAASPMFVAAALLCSWTAIGRAQSISLRDVLASVERHHPKISAALAKEDMAHAKLFAARGGFDPKLSAYGALRTGGYYELRRATVELRQPTPLWGAEVWAGYRFGQGIDDEQRFPTYYEDETLDTGEVNAGLRVPLWRDGPQDERRAARTRNGHFVTAATEAREATVLELQRKATDAYLAWVAAGRRLAVAEELLKLAEDRQAWVDARVKAGAIARVESLEVERSVLKRKLTLVSARRGTEATSYVLSLFYRDERGVPSTLGAAALPEKLSFPAAPKETPEKAFRQVVDCHPLLVEQRAALAASEVDQDLARARRAPQVDVQGQVSRDFGEGDVTLPGTVFEAGLVFSLPLPMRKARGDLRAANANVEATRQSLRFREDQLRMQLDDAASAFTAADSRRRLATDMIRNTRDLADAERRRFEAGVTTLFVVNLREQSLAEAEVAEVDAVRDQWKARAQWDALTTCNPDDLVGVARQANASGR